MIANHPIYGHNYSYHIRGDRSPLMSPIYLSKHEYIRNRLGLKNQVFFITKKWKLRQHITMTIHCQ